jgi:hypothetical protein
MQLGKHHLVIEKSLVVDLAFLHAPFRLFIANANANEAFPQENPAAWPGDVVNIFLPGHFDALEIAVGEKAFEPVMDAPILAGRSAASDSILTKRGRDGRQLLGLTHIAQPPSKVFPIYVGHIDAGQPVGRSLGPKAPGFGCTGS